MGVIGTMSSDPDSRSVLAFGAAGDGTADDTAAVREAIEAGTGGVRFPPGTYRLTDSVEIDLDATGPVSIAGDGTPKIVMEGAGPAFRFVGTHDGTAYPSTVDDAVWRSQRLPTVDGIEIVGNHPDAVGFEATGTVQLTLTRVLVREAHHGIHLRDLNRNVAVSGCHLYDNSGIGVYLDDVDLHQINVTGSHVSYNDRGGIVVRDGDVRNLQVGSCDIEANTSAAGPPTANVSIEMTEGSMREGAIVGCTLQHGSDPPASANVRFLGHGPGDRRKAGNFTIAGNALSDVRYNVHVRHGRGIVLTGNTFWKGYDHDVLVEESSNVVLGPNLLDRNPDYGGESRDGVVIRDSHDLTLTGLQVRETTDGAPGIELEGCRDYSVTNATLLDCDGGGLSLIDTSRGLVTGSLVRDDRPDGRRPAAVSVRGGADNLIATNYADGGVDADPGAAEVTGNYAG